MPATAAIDNETLDHLLSVVDDSGNLRGFRDLSKPGDPGSVSRARVVPIWDLQLIAGIPEVGHGRDDLLVVENLAQPGDEDLRRTRLTPRVTIINDQCSGLVKSFPERCNRLGRQSL